MYTYWLPRRWDLINCVTPTLLTIPGEYLWLPCALPTALCFAFPSIGLRLSDGLLTMSTEITSDEFSSDGISSHLRQGQRPGPCEKASGGQNTTTVGAVWHHDNRSLEGVSVEVGTRSLNGDGIAYSSAFMQRRAIQIQRSFHNKCSWFEPRFHNFSRWLIVARVLLRWL